MSDTNNQTGSKLTSKNEMKKKFFIFSAVFLFAIFALILVQSLKEDFDKTQQAPFLIVDAKDQSSIENATKLFTRPVTNADLVNVINLSLPAGENQQVNSPSSCDGKDDTTANAPKVLSEQKPKTHQIVCESVNNIWYRSFKTKSEVLDALNKEVLILKEKDLERLEIQKAKSVKTEDELKEKKESAVAELNKIKTDSSTHLYDYALLKKNTPSDSPLLPTFIKLSEKSKHLKKPVPEETLTSDVNEYFQKQIDEQQIKANQIEKEIDEIDKQYQSVIKSFYTTLIVNNKLKDISHPRELIAIQATYPNLQPFFDDKGTLNIFYKFAWITLTAIIVFALLYLILIPLKLIFFLTPAGEAVSEQSKKFLERKETGASAAIATVAATPIIPTLLATVATVGIGSAAIAAANPFGNNAVPKNSDQAEVSAPAIAQSQFRPNQPNNPNKRPGQSGVIDQSPVDELIAKLGDMQKSLDELRNDFAKRGTPQDGQNGGQGHKGDQGQGGGQGSPGVPASAEQIAAALENSFGRRFETLENLIRPSNDAMFTSLSNRINDLEKKSIGLNTHKLAADGTLFGNVNDVSRRVGEPNTTAQQSNTLFKNLESIIAETQSLSGISNNTVSLLTGLSTLSDNVGSKADAPGVDTLTGRVKQFEIDSSEIKKTSASIHNNLLWTDGKVFSKRYKTLITNNRYQISQSALNALNGEMGNTDIFAMLSRLITENNGQPLPLMSKKDLERMLKAINAKEWKTHRDLLREKMLIR
ncbi:MAG TPA: hypothetical protein VF648_04100 [Pyrinomonadaceae bacterium]|jgi:hypothetical protein